MVVDNRSSWSSRLRMNIIRIKKCIQNRIKFRRICKATGINPYKWVKSYVLRDTPMPTSAIQFARSGKTTAVLLKLLLGAPRSTLFDDPDFCMNGPRFQWYEHEYNRLASMCKAKGIDVRIFTRVILHKVGI